MRLRILQVFLLAISTFPSPIWSNDELDDDEEEGVRLVGNTITRTDVSDVANISQDIREMYSLCRRGDTRGARSIYTSGKYATHSLRYLATHHNHLDGDITFAFQTYGLSGGIPKDAAKHSLFASEYVEKQFDDGNCETAVHAAQYIILWMHVSYELWNTVKSCAIHADPTYDNEAAGVDNLPKFADQIVAYWVGSIQGDAEGSSGYSLYSAANEIGEAFGTDIVGGAKANRNILSSYEALSGILSKSDACTEYTRSMDEMWPVLGEISRQMMIPQIQFLIQAMLEEDKPAIDIFATIVVPQLSQCRYSSYKYLKEVFLDNEYDSSKFHKTLNVLKSLYPCLGLTCRDIGAPHKYNDSALGCPNYQQSPNLAGYPSDTDVQQQSLIDLDMHQINILTQYDNDEYWKLARRIYKLGKNSRYFDDIYYDDDSNLDVASFRSLHSLAISPDRSGTLFYDEFVTFFDDPNYADTLIMNAFDNVGRWANHPLEQRAAVIRTTMQTHLMYMQVLVKLDEAVKNCGGPNDDYNSGGAETDEGYYKEDDAWDEVAAYIIGSLEGEQVGGSDDFDDGEMLWSLGNNRCIEFGRENEERFAISNGVIFNLLLAGKGKLRVDSCDHIERYSSRIAHMLAIPIMQSVVKYAVVNRFKNADTLEVTAALGESYASAMIPIMSKYDKASALIVKDNMVPADKFQSLVGDGPQKVADTYLAVADEFLIECEYIGKTYDIDACSNYKHVFASGGSTKATSCAFFGMLGAALAFYFT